MRALAALLLFGCGIQQQDGVVDTGSVDLAVMDAAEGELQDMGAIVRDAQMVQCQPQFPACSTKVPFVPCTLDGRVQVDHCWRVCASCAIAEACQFEFAGSVVLCTSCGIGCI